MRRLILSVPLHTVLRWASIMLLVAGVLMTVLPAPAHADPAPQPPVAAPSPPDTPEDSGSPAPSDQPATPSETPGEPPSPPPASDTPFDTVRYLMCYFGRESIPGLMYQATQSNDVPFKLRSKTVAGGVYDPVSSILVNDMIDYGRATSFKDVNAAIRGFDEPLPLSGANVAPHHAEKPNQGPPVTVYDRFGLAGLQLTNYLGEWLYILVNACDPTVAPVDPRWNEFYESRLTPRSTWEDRHTSLDPRTIQFTGIHEQGSSAFMTNMTNNLFMVSKLIVGATIAALNLAYGGDSHQAFLGSFAEGGTFTRLFNGLYVVVIGLFAAVGFLQAMVAAYNPAKTKRAIVSVASMILVSGIMFAFESQAATAMGLPNTIARTIQHGFIQIIDRNYTSTEGICGLPHPQDGQGPTTVTPEAIQSMVACRWAEALAYRPFIQMQFGTSWNNLWGDTPPVWAGPNAKQLPLVAQWPGSPLVPLGGGTMLNNWGYFYISTLTDKHVPVEALDQNEWVHSGYNHGVALDYYRIVDALSGYNEWVDTMQVGNESTNITMTSTPATSEYWDSFIGNRPGDRLWIALSNIPIAGMVLLIPFMASIGIWVLEALLLVMMNLIPIWVLLFFLGEQWRAVTARQFHMMVNLFLTRVILGVVLGLYVQLTLPMISTITPDTYWEVLIGLAIVSYGLFSLREQLGRLVAAINPVKLAGGSKLFGVPSESVLRHRVVQRAEQYGYRKLSAQARAASTTVKQAVKQAPKKTVRQVNQIVRARKGTPKSASQPPTKYRAKPQPAQPTPPSTDRRDDPRRKQICVICKDQVGRGVSPSMRPLTADYVEKNPRPNGTYYWIGAFNAVWPDGNVKTVCPRCQARTPNHSRIAGANLVFVPFNDALY